MNKRQKKRGSISIETILISAAMVAVSGIVVGTLAKGTESVNGKSSTQIDQSSKRVDSALDNFANENGINFPNERAKPEESNEISEWYIDSQNVLHISGGVFTDLENETWVPESSGGVVQKVKEGYERGTTRDKVIKIVVEGKVILPENVERMFSGFTSVVEFEGLDNFDTSRVKNMDSMFANMESLENLDLRSWDVSNVRSFNSTFSQLASLPVLNLTGWTTSSAVEMNSMFSGGSIEVIQGIEHFDTSTVADMSYMFSSSNVSVLDLRTWDVSTVILMDGMFSGASVSNLIIHSWDVQKVESMNYMFSFMENINPLDLSNWDTKNVQQMTGVFSYMSNLQALYLDNWELTGIANNYSKSDMFYRTPLSLITTKSNDLISQLKLDTGANWVNSGSNEYLRS